MKEIELTYGKATQVDDDVYEELKIYNWYAVEGQSTWYAARWDSIACRPIYMHRQILSCKKKEIGDHKDGNGLNNQGDNLRKCSGTQNNANQGSHKGSTSKYRGVRHVPQCSRRPWISSIQCQGKWQVLGYFTTEFEAALAYNQKAIELFGEFARLNEIGGITE